MPFAHNVFLRVHCHATEEEDRVAQALALLAVEAKPTRTLAEGHHKNPIVVLEVEQAKKHADQVWARVRASREVAARLLAEVERRMDDTGTFYARFDKQRAYLGELALTQGDDAIHFRSKVAAFPQRKEEAVLKVQAFLSEPTASQPKA